MANSAVGGWTGELLTDTTFVPAWIPSGLPSVPTGTTAAVGFDSTDSGNDPRIATTCPGVLGDGARTVAAWIKGDLQQPNFGVIVAWGRNATAGRYTFRVETATGANTGKLRLEVQGHALVGETVVMDGAWHHVAVVTPQGGSAHTSTLYVDGVPQSRTLFGTAAPLNTLVDLAVPTELVHIGNGGWSLGAYGFKGQIDDVRLYDEALSGAQILELAAGAGTPPPLTQPLANQTIVLGDPAAQATFTAAASGSPPLAFEWRFDGAVLAGQTGASLTLNPATPADAGDYTVTVSNAAGTVSSTARLLLGTGPVELNQQAALVGEPAAFRVTMPSGPAYTYQWRFNSADLPGQTSAVLALEDLEAADAGTYAVRVTLGSNSAQSSDAVLRVLPVPTSPYAAAILRDGPAAYWRLGESAGATQAADATGFHPAAFVNFTGVELGQPGAILNEPATTPFEIYNVLHDPKEQTNLASGPLGATLQTAMQDRVLQLRRPLGSAPRPYDDALIPPAPGASFQPRLAFQLFQGDFPWVPDFATLNPVSAGTCPGLDPELLAHPQADAVLYAGFVEAPADGRHTFYLSAEGRAFLRLHDASLIDADFAYLSGTERSASVSLKAGLHPFRLGYVRGDVPKPRLTLHWSGPDTNGRAGGPPRPAATQRVTADGPR